ncbi:hypothetical protein HSISS2_897 [Streptococcus sp. HSISS2]|nr:hypothetical protein HSISS2_897 [Streptococcus sp. HSISS2]
MDKSQIVDLAMGIRSTFRFKYLKSSMGIFGFNGFVNYLCLTL